MSDAAPPVSRSSRVKTAQKAVSVVMIGNGMAGFKCCEQLTPAVRDGRIKLTVFGEESLPAYDRVHLTRLLGNATPEQLLLAPAGWYSSNGITLLTGEQVVAVDPAQRVIRSATGRETAYDQLVFATGSRAFVPEIPGHDLPGVFVYRTVNDLQAMLRRAADGRRAVVLGGGLLGLEAARALHDLGLKTWVVERGTGLLARQLDPTASQLLRQEVESSGVIPILGRETAAIHASGSNLLLEFQTGEHLRADLVVFAVGIRPRDELARDCGLEIAPRGGIRINDWLQTSDPEIYAIGECASHHGVIYGLAAPAYQMADVLATNLGGGRKRFTGASHATRLKLPGMEVVTLGDYQADGETLVRQEKGIYRRLVLENGRLIGAVGVGSWIESPRIQELVERRGRIWRWSRNRFLRTGHLYREEALSVVNWSPDALVCNCTGVRRGALSAACAAGCVTVEQLARKTGASTVCGSCRPLLAEIVGAPATAPAMKGMRLLLIASLAALLFALVTFAARPLAYSQTVRPGWHLDHLWRNTTWKQVTGFTLLGVSLLSLVFSLRKRIKRFTLGDFGSWRALHATLGMITLVVLVTHTGFRFGRNLNFILMLNFLALAAVGGLAGAVAALERRLSPVSARQLRNFWNTTHLALAWPLPALVLFHVLAAYFF